MLKNFLSCQMTLFHWWPVPRQHYYGFFDKYLSKPQKSPYFIQLNGSSISSIGLMTHDIININMWIRPKQWFKSRGPYYLTKAHISSLWHIISFTLMILAHESHWKNFGNHGLKLWSKLISLIFNSWSNGLKLIKETCCLACFL